MDALSRIAPKMVAAVVEFVYGDLVDNPAKVGAPLSRGLTGSYKAVRGPYRVIYSFDEVEVRIERVEHRSDVYRPH